jgi:hypothetical protein
VDAVFGDLEEQLLAQTVALQGALQPAVAVRADGQDAADARIERRLRLAAQLEGDVHQASLRQRRGLDVGFLVLLSAVFLQQADCT